MDLEQRKTELLEERQKHYVTINQIDGAIAMLNEQIDAEEANNDEDKSGIREDGAAESS